MSTKADKVKAEMTESDEQPAENFQIAQTGPHHYTVRSNRGETPRAHRVDVCKVRCSCEDMTYNKAGSSVTAESDEGREICDHLAHVLDEHPQLTAEEMALYESMGLRIQADNLRSQLDMQLNRFEEALVELRDVEAGHGGVGSTETAETDSTEQSDVDEAAVQEKAAELQEAFDDLVEDMEVKAHAGVVWFKTGYDTPEEWPYPGGDNTWEVLVKNPDQPEYVGEGGENYAEHELYDEKPGEYWKNIVRPEDVEEYIDEVLG